MSDLNSFLTKNYTFGFKPCVFELRRLGQKHPFQNNIVLQMYVQKNSNVGTNTQSLEFVLDQKLYTFGFKPCVFDLRQFDQKNTLSNPNVYNFWSRTNSRLCVLVPTFEFFCTYI
jgi:hypothetical protein